MKILAPLRVLALGVRGGLRKTDFLAPVFVFLAPVFAFLDCVFLVCLLAHPHATDAKNQQRGTHSNPDVSPSAVGAIWAWRACHFKRLAPSFVFIGASHGDLH